jgi:hypothetical protein
MGASPAKQSDEPTEGVIATTRVSQQFREWLNRKAEEDESTRSYEVAASQLDRMLSAESLDDIMDSDNEGTHQGRDLVGFEFEWKGGFRIAKTAPEFEAPLGVYAQFEATALIDFPQDGIAVGDLVLISTGAPLVIGKLRTLEANGYTPIRLKFTSVKGPRGTVLKLGRPPVRAESV